MANRLSRIGALLLLTLALGSSVYYEGGDVPLAWNISLLVIGVTAVVYWLIAPAAEQPPAIGRLLGGAVLLAPLYIAFQCVPLPLPLLRLLSPNRANTIAYLSGVMEPPRFAALSINPALSFRFFLNVAVYAIVFLLVRDLAWRSWRRRSMAGVMPLMLIAGLEAWLGFLQSAPGGAVQGTYRNRNHFAGLLEMVLPLAVAYAVAHFTPGRITGVLKAGAGLALAALMLASIIYSQSKMGFTACLGGLFLLGALVLIGKVEGKMKWLWVAALALVFLAVFFFLPTDQLASAYTEFASNDPASAEGRQPIWSDSLHLLRAYPVFGSGMGTYGTAFLKYQTALVDLDYSFAHNDYLQLATELGFAGFLIFFGLMSAVLLRAIRAATQGPDRAARALGAGCAGAIAAIAIHSLTDFNMYVPANALVLAWIAGVVAGVPRTSTHWIEDQEEPEVSGAGRPVFRRFVAGFACVVIAYVSAALLLETRFQGDLRAEAQFCRFGLCDTDSIVAAQTKRGFLTALRREPAAPHRWCDLGEAMLTSGDVQQARYCFSKALDLGRNIPPVMMRAAHFYRAVDGNERGLEESARVLEKSTIDDPLVFDWYTAEKFPVTEILSHGLPEGPRATQAYLRYLIGLDRAADAAEVWEWALTHRCTDDRFARDYVNYLAGNRRYMEAAQTWARYLGNRRNGYLQSNWLLNGDFESEPSGLAFDWRIDAQDSVTTKLDSAVAHTGKKSLRIDFGGKDNVNYSQTTQMAVVTPGVYHFEAFVRTQAVTTDQGVGFHIYDPEKPARLDLQTEHLIGTNDWKRIEKTVTVTRGTRLVSVGITRVPTLRFDNKISGTAWIDGASLRKVE